MQTPVQGHPDNSDHFLSTWLHSSFKPWFSSLPLSLPVSQCTMVGKSVRFFLEKVWIQEHPIKSYNWLLHSWLPLLLWRAINFLEAHLSPL